MVALPAVTPVTRPVAAFTVALGEALNQLPPGVPVVVNKMEDPAHTVLAPEIVPALGVGFTVMLNEAEDAPHALVTV